MARGKVHQRQSGAAGRNILNNVFNADLKWFSADFPGATNQNARLSGSPYVPPSQARLFNWTNGVMALSGGDLPTAIFANVLLNDEGSFAIPSNPNNIQLGVPNATGGITGSFTHRSLQR